VGRKVSISHLGLSKTNATSSDCAVQCIIGMACSMLLWGLALHLHCLTYTTWHTAGRGAKRLPTCVVHCSRQYMQVITLPSQGNETTRC
jgi:hypothetical protein